MCASCVCMHACVCACACVHACVCVIHDDSGEQLPAEACFSHLLTTSIVVTELVSLYLLLFSGKVCDVRRDLLGRLAGPQPAQV